MEENSTVSLVASEDIRKKELLAALAKARKRLMVITEKVTLLDMELNVIRQEYISRIGRLYQRDDMLDFEIIRYKSIKELMDQGLSYAKAVEKLESQFFNQNEEKYEEMFDFSNIEKNGEQPEIVVAVKKLWKKLLFQFHPDLARDETEKRRREALMKQVNKAYTENDLETLQLLEQNQYIEPEDDSSTAVLERMLVTLENSVLVQENKYKDLRASEWHQWKRKKERAMAKKKKVDVFAELEDRLLEDIIKKVDILQKLKKEVN